MKEEKKIKIIVVTGPTATGKTRLAVRLAGRFNGEIISADSRQVYKGLDIGSGKDLHEYGAIPCHLIDIVEPSEEYNLMRFRNEVPEIILDIDRREKLPLIAGGSALYIDSILSEYSLPGKAPDPELRKNLREMAPDEISECLKKKIACLPNPLNDRNNRNRLVRAIEIAGSGSSSANPMSFDAEYLVIGVYFDRKQVHQRIEERLEQRLKNGIIEEVEHLHNQGLPWERLEFFGLEYRYLAFYLQGKMTFPEMRQKLLEKIRQFAKRQDIWFRKMEREGRVIHWIREGCYENACRLVELFLADKMLPPPELSISEIYYGKKTS
ncbi:MAG: tRNA (adenosine(37)-N6)-dimethylallyltransferase MiaA [Lentisphaerae bacterium GWF2_50_93]|nr:MAG: tRNA (adenosine(37)-N6)-dimethylallyltransferase MiaA [Lentisphaerae bacterium GWF2_50_93]